MDAREQRGLVIAALCKLGHAGENWFVPSQSDSAKCYTVNPKRKTCTCPDYSEGFECKHIHAVQFTMKREVAADGTVTETQSITFTEEKKYTQNWPAYNEAQSTEKNRLLSLLSELCDGIEEPERKATGRKPVSIRDRLFACVFKIYSTVSSRRFDCDLRDLQERGLVRRSMHYNKVNCFLESPELTAALQTLLTRSALPLKAVETEFAVDSSGFSVSRHVRWHDEKYGMIRSGRDWVKAHICCGVKTNVVTAVEIRERDANDSPILPDLVNATATNFRVSEVSADKGYLSADNVNAIDAVGGTAYIMPKVTTTGQIGGLFEKMYFYYQFKREEFLSHYHKRSNVESTFSAVKRKFGDNVRSKTDVAMKNEVLCKFICHNLCCVIKSQIELGIEPEFWATSDKPEGLQMVRRN